MDYKQAEKLIRELMDEEEINIRSEEELYIFLTDPAAMTDNERIIAKAKDLQELLDMMGGKKNV